MSLASFLQRWYYRRVRSRILWQRRAGVLGFWPLRLPWYHPFLFRAWRMAHAVEAWLEWQALRRRPQSSCLYVRSIAAGFRAMEASQGLRYRYRSPDFPRRAVMHVSVLGSSGVGRA